MAAAPAPILSVRGTLAALRVPTPRDVVFSVKAALAVVICLLIGFSQNLENPYWSALTVYVLMGQPEAGAIRSKAIFRLIGTLLGGALAILIAMVFASHVGALLIASIIVVLATFYLKTLDRTPAGYTWFATPLTVAVVAIAQAPAPDTIFAFAMTRTLEICLAIVIVGLVDSLVLPRAATPAFLHTMEDWRSRAADWAAAALAQQAPQTLAQRQERRLGLHKLAGLLGPLDALGVQLPYDIVPVPPHGRDMRLVRLTIAHLIVHLASANIWIEAARAAASSSDVETMAAQARDWLLERPEAATPAALDHAARGMALRDRLAAFDTHAEAPDGLTRATALLRLSELVDHWARLEQALYAIATGSRLPADLRRAAWAARPLRCTDYLLGLLDVAPMALALTFCALLWYLTTWTASIAAMLFVFISLGFISGTPGALRASRGITFWIAVTSLIALAYQFAVLPRVTAFPVLIAVLLIGLLPLGILATMSPAGVLILANGFAFLGLQSAYTADFGATLELLGGSLAGCLIATAALYLCQFDRSRFRARRLARGLRQDLTDIARSRRMPGSDRLISLSVDRMTLYFGLVDGLPPEDPLHREDLIDTFRIASNLLHLRAQEAALSEVPRAQARLLRQSFAQTPIDRQALLPLTDAARDAVWHEPLGPPRTAALSALTGLRLSLAASPAFPPIGAP